MSRVQHAHRAFEAIDLRRGASAVQRVVEAIRRHFFAYGGPPSYRELTLATGIQASALPRVLDLAEDQGLITRRRGTARGIALVDRCEMFSAAELTLAFAARGWSVQPPLPEASALVAAFAPAPLSGADCELPLAGLLGQIDAVSRGGVRRGVSGTSSGSGATAA